MVNSGYSPRHSARAVAPSVPIARRGGRRLQFVIVAVAEGSEAERAGVAPGDTVVSVGGQSAATMAEARAKMSGPLGDDVLLTLRRPSGVETLRVPREPVRR